ncbi:YdeI/OmpD-associated family protein [uncultured Erythrobacter sp.]|uniref:YdeI/OmpD-associated family protein n=1 Tax=uncultured Erythrobacter sp. TaxID=263913 RepID=UPI00265B2CF9|nr:YdeI/OmpD-associated family protein [uncultured Erythrobacter sp.]
MTHDPRIDDYIAKAAPFAQPILTHVRVLVHQALPEAEEAIKWGMPHFMVGGKNVVGLAAFKAHASVVIHHEERGEGMGSLGKLANLADLPGDGELIARFQAGHTAIGTAKPKRAPKPEPSMPPALAAALDAAPEAKRVFDAFAPSHRREYVEWVAEAKRDETRDKRIAQAIEWLAEGKKRHWKYEDC